MGKETSIGMAFNLIEHGLANPLVLVFLSWIDSFTLHTDASLVGTGAALAQMI